MYKKIENEFLQESYFKKADKIIILVYIFPILFCLISMIFRFNNKILFVIIYILLLVLCALFLYVILFINLKKFKNKRNKTFFNIFHNISKYKEYVHEEDILTLTIILEKYEIKQTILIEMINHYRHLIPINIRRTNDMLPFVSLIVSLVALFSTDFYTNNIINVVNAIAIIGFSLLMYFCAKSVKSFMHLILGKEDLYRKLEATLSEIYIQEILK